MEQKKESGIFHSEFVKGFNEGYIMAQFMPDIASKIAEAVKGSERGNGFEGGQKQYQHEKAMERKPSWLKRRDMTEGKDKADTKTKPDIEPEKG